MQRRNAIAAVITAQMAHWLAESGTPTPASINCGHCADFRDGVFHAFKQQPALADVDFDDIYYSDLALDEDRPAPPPGLTWEQLSGRNGLLKRVCHEWIQLDGLHFDSEVPEGVENPFDVPCVRRCLVGALTLDHPDLLTTLVRDPWWQDSLRLATDNLRWYVAFFEEPADATSRTMLAVMERACNEIKAANRAASGLWT